MRRVVQLCAPGCAHSVRKEAVWTVANFALGGTAEQIKATVRPGLIRALVDGLSFDDSDLLLAVIGGLSKVLNVGAKVKEKGENPFLNLMEECKGSRFLEMLKHHKNKNVRVSAGDFLQKFLVGVKKRWVWRKKNIDATSNPPSNFSPASR